LHFAIILVLVYS